MCTENSPDDITVCDIAITSVRDAFSDGDGVTFAEAPGGGTRVANTNPSERERFRRRLDAAIAPHGGSLPKTSN